MRWFGEKERGRTEMVWTCAEKRCWVYQEKDTGGGASREEEVYRCDVGGHVGSWCDRERCRGEEQTIQWGNPKKKKVVSTYLIF